MCTMMVFCKVELIWKTAIIWNLLIKTDNILFSMCRCHYFDGHWYQFNKYSSPSRKTSWSYAYYYCQNQFRGQLVSITSYKELDFIRSGFCIFFIRIHILYPYMSQISIDTKWDWIPFPFTWHFIANSPTLPLLPSKTEKTTYLSFGLLVKLIKSYV